MANGVQLQCLYHVQIRSLLHIMGIVVAALVLSQLLMFPFRNFQETPSHSTQGSFFATIGSSAFLNSPKFSDITLFHRAVNDTVVFHSEDETRDGNEMESMENNYYVMPNDDGELDDRSEIDENGQALNEITSQSNLDLDKNLRKQIVIQADSSSNLGVLMGKSSTLDKPQMTNPFAIPGEIHNQSDIKSISFVSPRKPLNKRTFSDPTSETPFSTITTKQSPTLTNPRLLKNLSVHSTNNAFVIGNLIMKKRGPMPTSIAHMNLALLQYSDSVRSMKPQWSSSRDQELQSARFQIESAPILRNSPQLYASLFRNVSVFKRSYELMERILKVYIYKEGEKPIFHQPHMRGIYASEGWFMKLMEGNKQFVTRDPRKAHLFYIPISLLKLRSALYQEKFSSQKDLEKYLKNYTDIIARKYHFWNRARGADHFLVGCHDWAPRITRKNTGNCIRALCNSNVARGFTIGKDVSLPVTYIRSAQNPQRDLGGNSPSERPILAFFAGSMHGYLRPILLQHWEYKEADMKIFGPMPRDIEGKTKYREYMKSSKYCICARGYEVHTPRVVEAIYSECVPVIISDNYVPPLFEVLDWESFSIFVSENDIPNLRNILLSIPEEKYRVLQQRVKMVQRHFLWHKKPVKYDLFHMILHSVWYNRVFQNVR